MEVGAGLSTLVGDWPRKQVGEGRLKPLPLPITAVSEPLRKISRLTDSNGSGDSIKKSPLYILLDRSRVCVPRGNGRCCCSS